MFLSRCCNRYTVLKQIVKERRRLYQTQFSNAQEAVIQALCWTDPYAMLTITNYPYVRVGSIYRFIGELFFDQQAHSYVHSSDIFSFIVLVVLMQMKLQMLKQK